MWCGGGLSIPSGVSVAVGDGVSSGIGNQISPNFLVLTGLCLPSVTLSLSCRITRGSVAANINAFPPLSGPPHISVHMCGCCGVWFSVLLCVLVSIHSQPQFCCNDVCAV